MKDSNEQLSADSTTGALGGEQLLRHLIETRSTRAERLSQDDVMAAVHEVGHTAKSAVGQRQLEAVSLLGKAMETFNAKVAINLIRQELQAALSRPIAPLSGWGLAIDRYYLAVAVRESSSDWIAQYAARAFASIGLQEEKARDAWAELAVSRAPSLTIALSELTDALSEIREADDAPLGRNYRRIIRVCRGLSRPLPSMDIPLGDGFGRAFLALGRNVEDGSKGAEAARLREDAATALLGLTVQVLRLRFEAIFDSDMYRATGAIRAWWKPAKPPEAVEVLSDRILAMAMSGIHILAKQGTRDIELRQTLVRAFGSQKVDSVGRRLAEGDLSLRPDDAEWLSAGRDHRATKSHEAVRGLTEAKIDAAVGDLLSAIGRPDADPGRLKAAADGVELYDADASELMRAFAGQVQLNNQAIETLASLRGLRTYGRFGEVVSFDHGTHDTHSVIQRGATVRITVPGILREEPGKQPLIIKKALVEEN